MERAGVAAVEAANKVSPKNKYSLRLLYRVEIRRVRSITNNKFCIATATIKHPAQKGSHNEAAADNGYYS